MWPNPQETVDLVTFTEEIRYGKLYFLCSGAFKLPVVVWKISKNHFSQSKHTPETMTQ